MPVRIASLSRQLHKNGQRLHLAMASRAFSQGPEQPADEAEQALREERNLLKEQQKQRRAQALLPKPKAAKLVKEAKPPKPPKAPKEANPRAPTSRRRRPRTSKPPRRPTESPPRPELAGRKPRGLFDQPHGSR